MILQRLVNTNLLFIAEKPSHSIESGIFSLVVALVSFLLFIFWKRKGAFISFQAWALLMGLINLILFFHFSPISIHIKSNGFEYQFTSKVLRMLMGLQFLTSAITIWKFWKLSERYIPKDLLYQKRYFTLEPKKLKNHVKRSLFVRVFALWHIVKYGGNDIKNDRKVRKSIRTIARIG